MTNKDAREDALKFLADEGQKCDRVDALRAAVSTIENWTEGRFPNDEQDAITRAIFGVRATFSDWGLVNKCLNENSLDAAKALHEAVLPGWDWRVEENVEGFVCHIGPTREEFMPSFLAVSFKSSSRAWLIAIIRALIAEGE